ncbi:MAG: carboxypeptidase regulatory-like domain-containing protein, partial [Acidobacteriaceae bacterium]|nr:carboxypeptidase regulatory-like domain-containing protein [Acidobacteriaceae bacterium]
MRLALGALLLLSGGCLCISAGQEGQGTAPPVSAQSTSPARRTITGTVVNSVTGEPIRRALVQLAGPRQSFAFTGADGRFQIENFPEGDVYLSAQKPGFFDASQAGHGPLILKSGTNDALIKLNPQASIQGRIVDNDGEPIEAIQVELIGQQIVNGRKEWQPRETVQTRENGSYRIDNLMPGIYVVHTVVRPEFGSQFGQESDQLQQQAYPERFYPSSPDFASAQPMDLK